MPCDHRVPDVAAFEMLREARISHPGAIRALSLKPMSPGFARLAPVGIGDKDAAFLRGDGTLKQKVASLETYAGAEWDRWYRWQRTASAAAGGERAP